MSNLWTELFRAMGQSDTAGGIQEIPGLPTTGQETTADSAPGAVGFSAPIEMPGGTTVSGGSGLLEREIAGSTQAPGTAGASSPEGPASDTTLMDSLSRLTAGLEQLRLTASTQVDGLLQNTQAVSQNTLAQSTKSGSSTASMLGKIFSPIFQMTGISPIVSGIMSLFGGGNSEAPAPLTPYVAPAPIHYQGIVSAGPETARTQAASAWNESGQMAESGTGAAPGSAIQINVQTMDSRSFLDHSEQIASAVREALLRAHPLNDLLSED